MYNRKFGSFPVSCPKGTKFNTATKLCDDCPPGMYQNMTGQTECRTCDSGFDTYSTGSEKCTGQSAGVVLFVMYR